METLFTSYQVDEQAECQKAGAQNKMTPRARTPARITDENGVILRPAPEVWPPEVLEAEAALEEEEPVAD